MSRLRRVDLDGAVTDLTAPDGLVAAHAPLSDGRIVYVLDFERDTVIGSRASLYVLDPATGTCELYEFRPVICRTFGPPLMSEGDLGVCDLCFDGATEAEITACEMKPDPDNLEPALLEELEKTTGAKGETIIAFALVR